MGTESAQGIVYSIIFLFQNNSEDNGRVVSEKEVDQKIEEWL
jgi:hypothetical protein